MGRKKGAILSYIALMFEVISGLLFTPFLIRMFGQGEYGIYGLVLNITAYMTLLDMGVGNSIVKYIAQYRINGQKDKERKVLGITIIFYTAVAIIVLCIGGIVAGNADIFFGKGLMEEELKRAQIMLMITLSNCAITMWLYSFNKVIIAYERFTVSQGLLIVRIVLKIILLVPILLLGGKGIATVFVDMALTIVLGVFSVYYVVKVIGLSPMFVNLDFGFIKEIVVYSTFIFIQMIATQINAMADQILIAALIPASAAYLAIYGLGSQICSYLQRIAAAINGVLMPGAVKMVEKKASSDDYEKEMTRVGRPILAILIMVWVNLLCFGKTFISIYGGPDYAMSYWVIVLISFPMVLSLPQSIGTQILWAMNKHRDQALLKIAITAVNIVLTIFLIQWNPVIGASLGTCIALFTGDVIVMGIVFRKDIKINLLRYYRGLFNGIVLAFVISGIVGMGLKLFETGGIVNFMINCACVTLTYVVVMWLKGCNEYERHLIQGILSKIKKRGG